MKIKCISQVEDRATFLLPGKHKPIQGNFYNLEKYEEDGTAPQRKAFHSLCESFWLWMVKTNTYQFEDNGIEYDFRNPNEYLFREQLKFQYGKGAKFYGYYDDGEKRWFYVKDIQDVPDEILLRWRNGEKHLITWKDTYSMSKYTKKDYSKIITNLKTIIAISQCSDKSVEEILKGMEA